VAVTRPVRCRSSPARPTDPPPRPCFLILTWSSYLSRTLPSWRLYSRVGNWLSSRANCHVLTSLISERTRSEIHHDVCHEDSQPRETCLYNVRTLNLTLTLTRTGAGYDAWSGCDRTCSPRFDLSKSAILECIQILQLRLVNWRCYNVYSAGLTTAASRAGLTIVTVVPWEPPPPAARGPRFFPHCFVVWTFSV